MTSGFEKSKYELSAAIKNITPHSNDLCFAAAENCSGYRTCGQCLDQPGCGWCTDPSNTGKGQCIEGSYRGPFQTSVPAPSTLPGLPASPQPALNASMCPGEAKYNWSFIHCPGRRRTYSLTCNLRYKLCWWLDTLYFCLGNCTNLWFSGFSTYWNPLCLLVALFQTPHFRDSNKCKMNLCSHFLRLDSLFCDEWTSSSTHSETVFTHSF